MKNDIKTFVNGILSLDVNRDFIFIKGADLKYLYANSNYCSLFNITLNDIFGKRDNYFIKDLKALKNCEKSDKIALENNQIICAEKIFGKEFSILKIKINLNQTDKGILCLAKMK